MDLKRGDLVWIKVKDKFISGEIVKKGHLLLDLRGNWGWDYKERLELKRFMII